MYRLVYRTIILANGSQSLHQKRGKKGRKLKKEKDNQSTKIMKIYWFRNMSFSMPLFSFL